MINNAPMVRLGDYIAESEERNRNLTVKLSQGISNLKFFQEPKQVAENSKSDKIVRSGQFAYNRATTRNGEKISIAYRDGEDCTVSSAYGVFYITRTNELDPQYLMLFFKRAEFDRYARWRSEGSAHEFFTFEMMQNVEIPLPNIETQRALVAVYNGLQKVIADNEALIRQMEEVCHAFVVDCKTKYPKVKLGEWITECDERNSDLSVKLSQGISNLKYFQAPKQVAENSKSDKIVRKGHFAYNRATTRNGEKISIAYRDGEDCTVSSAYGVFKITNEEKLNPYFLMMFFKRVEFDRYARWRSEGSAHEFFTFEMMQNVEIPFPSIEIQRAIAEIYIACDRSKRIVQETQELMKNLCPALVQKAAHSA